MASGEAKRRRGAEHRERMARRSREQTASVSDVGTIPRVKNTRRKAACRLDLQRFLQVYFPNSTGLSPFSADHERVIARIQSCILRGGRFVNAVYRGFAKTTISENAAIWAILNGHRRFVVLFGADGKAAGESMESIQLELETNDLLYADFPEVCHAIRKLEGKPQRAGAQHHQGKRTFIEWTAERIVLPTIAKSKASGAVIVCRGMTAGFRGLKKKLPDGTQPRPDLVIPDDPQTDESAASQGQVNKTLGLFRKGIAKLGTHRKALAIVVNATVIQRDDAIDQLLRDSAWQGERIPLVRQWPECHETLWLDKYATLRRTYAKDQVDDQERAKREATEFYRAHREEMDRGAVVSWENCYDPETELSALQHAYNALIDDGKEAFASEFQVNPLPPETKVLGELVAAEVAARLNHQVRGLVPGWANRVTAFLDAHNDLLFWAVCAWGEGFTGAVLDYGSWPEQDREYYTLADARPTLRQWTRIGTIEGALWAGLEQLATRLLKPAWGRHRIERCLVDSGWGPTSDLVKRFCRESSQGAVLLPSQGVGITAGKAPIDQWAKKEGERRGTAWTVRPPVSSGQIGKLLLFDANHWKSFLHGRLSQPLGEKGALTLFGDDPATHRLLADHCTAEYREQTANPTRGREVEEWNKFPNRDNHLWDCLVGCCVAASEQGTTLVGPGTKREEKRVSYRQMYEQARRKQR